MSARLWVTIERVGQQQVVIPTGHFIVMDSDYLQITREPQINEYFVTEDCSQQGCDEKYLSG